MKPVQHSEYLVNTVDIDGLVLYHQDISGNNDLYALFHFQLFMG